MILGLDLSSVATGFSVMRYISDDSTQYKGFTTSLPEPKGGSGIELITYGCIRPPKIFSSSGKIEFIYDNIQDVLKEYPICTVAIEDQYFKLNAKTLKLLSNICGVAMLAAQQAKCEIAIYEATKTKKFFTGDGRASKKDMINMAMAMFKIEDGVIDDNIADAIAVAYTHLILINRKEPL